jgi:CO/xanthine dehydrogenase FAD-binding subunit
MWTIEAGSSLQAVLDRPDGPPLLRQALTGALDWQTRNRITVLRALRAPQLAPEWVAALLALDAAVVVEGDAGSTQMPVAALVEGRLREDIAFLHVPLADGDQRWGEARVGRTPADQPIVAAVAVVEMVDDVVEQARVALTGVWPEPVRLAAAPVDLVGGPLDMDGIRSVAEAVEAEVSPEGDFRGSEEYRRAMAGVLTRRALEKCLGEGRE